MNQSVVKKVLWHIYEENDYTTTYPFTDDRHRNTHCRGGCGLLLSREQLASFLARDWLPYLHVIGRAIHCNSLSITVCIKDWSSPSHQRLLVLKGGPLVGQPSWGTHVLHHANVIQTQLTIVDNTITA